MNKAKDTVLYVDDDAVNLEIFKALLDDIYEVVTVTSTAEAFAVLQNKPIKVLVSDQRMPEETGLQFIHRIHPIYPHVVKILFTAYQDQETTMQALNQGGIFKFLLKPCNSKEIKLTLDGAITEYNLKFENNRLLHELRIMNDELKTAYLKAKETERKFRGIFENSNDGIIILKDENIVEANATFASQIGFDCDILDKSQITPFLKRLYPALLRRITHQSLEGGVIAELDQTLVNGDKKYFEASSRHIDFDNDTMVLSVIRDITERKSIDKKILDAIIKTQEEDQVKYARELHDGLGPILSALKMYIEWLSDSKNTVNKDKITEQSIRSINEAITIVKEIANNLSPHVLQRFGLVNALQSYIDQIKATVNTEFILSANLSERLSPNIEISFYRILLESINNSIKHAKAQRVSIRIKKSENLLSVSYSDNGKGFDLDEVMNNGKGMGLVNMQNRVKSIGGEIRMKSAPGFGTEIEINVYL